MSKRKQNGIFFILLVLILILVSQLFWHLARNHMQNLQERNQSVMGIQAEKENSIDVLVLGDSEGYSAISPVQLWQSNGVPSYICAQPAQKIQETYYMLKTACRTQNPKLVVIETNVLFRGSKKWTDDAQTALAETGRYYLPVLRYHNLWKSLFQSNQTETDSYKGFIVREKVDSCDKESAKSYMDKSDKKQEMPQVVSIYMDQILKLCRDNDIKVLLVSVPSTMNHSYKRHNTLVEYAEKENLDYVDLNTKTEELGINWDTDSRDKGDHLNISGAQKVTKYLGEYLKEHYELADKREDDAYQDWNSIVAQYNSDTTAKIKKIRGTGKDMYNSKENISLTE